MDEEYEDDFDENEDEDDISPLDNLKEFDDNTHAPWVNPDADLYARV